MPPQPGEWTPIAGGTELMVAYAAGRLSAPKLVSLWGIPDLRFIETNAESIVIGAATTFRDLREHAAIAAELPLLAKAASWIGSIANQSRATIGGNLVNGSPAADSSPALLVYDAEIEMISVRGNRRIPYSEFHTGYKRNALAADELLYAIHLPRRFARHRQYLRKVGTRRAMAISKVALAATALLEDGVDQRDSPRRGKPGAISRAALSNRSCAARQADHARDNASGARGACWPKPSRSTTSAPQPSTAARGRQSARGISARAAPGGIAVDESQFLQRGTRRTKPRRWTR